MEAQSENRCHNPASATRMAAERQPAGRFIDSRAVRRENAERNGLSVSRDA
jgi:hypothetical protein